MTDHIRPGLCSITLRSLTPAEVIDVASRAGLEGIEWGADRHVRPGDTDGASVVANLCRSAGLECPSYGSYFMASETSPDELDPIYGSALALGASNVRLWAPFGITSDSPAPEREQVAESLGLAADRATERGLTVSLEFHPGTLTVDSASALDLLSTIDRPNLYSYWQPDPKLSPAESIAEMVAMSADLSHLHVFEWGTGFDDRFALADGEERWSRIIEAVPETSRWNADRWAFLEYVANDDPDQVIADAATLRRWLKPEEGLDA